MIWMLVVFLCIATPVSADVWLGPNGPGGGNGTQASPYGSFSTAFNATPCGQTLWVNNGTYTNSNSGYFRIDSRNCSAGMELTIKAVNERQAHIAHDGTSNGGGAGVYITNSSYITIEGLRATSMDVASSGNCNDFTGPGGAWNECSPTNPMSAGSSHHLIFRRNIMSHPNRYGNAHAVEILATSSSLFEENEVYDFHRHGIVVGSISDGNTLRRNYVNSRGRTLICNIYPRHGGCPGAPAVSVDPNKGNASIAIYPGSNNIVENHISEGNFHLIEINGTEPCDNNRILGTISLDDNKGTWVEKRANDTTNTTFTNFVAIRPEGTAGNSGFMTLEAYNTRCDNCTIMDPGEWGFRIDHYNDAQSTFFADNALILNAPTNAVIATIQGSGGQVLLRYPNLTGSAGNSSGVTVQNQNTSSPGLGTCKVYIPDGSPLRNAGLPGATPRPHIGAHILWRYHDGNLTNVPLWDQTTGAFPCGAQVAGVNDNAANACIGVHQRLSVNQSGCPFPSEYSGTPPEPPAPPTVSFIDFSDATNIPSGFSLDETWGALGLDDDGRVYIGISSRWTLPSGNPGDVLFFRYTPTSGAKEYLGRLREISNSYGNLLSGERIAKVHTHIVTHNGKLYWASSDYHGGETPSTIRGSHVYSYDPATEVFDDLTRHITGATPGVIAPTQGWQAIDILTAHNKLGGLSYPDGKPLIFDLSTNPPTAQVYNAPVSFVNVSRKVWGTAFGNGSLYFSYLNNSPTWDVPVYRLNSQTGAIATLSSQILNDGILHMAQHIGGDTYLKDEIGTLYRWTDSTETLTNLGSIFPGGGEANLDKTLLKSNDNKVLFSVPDNTDTLYQYVIATGTKSAVATFPTSGDTDVFGDLFGSVTDRQGNLYITTHQPASPSGANKVRLIKFSNVPNSPAIIDPPVGLSPGPFYVSAGGHSDTPSDNNTCLQAKQLATPKATIASALSCMSGGGTIYLRGGTYNQRLDAASTVIRGGTSWSAPTTIAAYQSEVVTLAPSGTGSIVSLDQADNTYIVFDRINLNGGGNVDRAIFAGGAAHHIRFQNAEIQNSTLSLVRFDACTGCELLNSTVHGSPFRTVNLAAGSVDNIILGNTIYGYTEHGISDEGSTVSTNSGNRFIANIIRTPNASPTGAGIMTNFSTNALISNNRIYSGRGGVDVRANTTNARIYNNTVWNNTTTGIVITAGAGTNRVQNNIVYQSVGITNNGTSTTLSNNLTTDPSFVNSGAGDLHITTGSAAKDTGTTLADVPVDMEDQPRPQGPAYDIGADEFLGPSGPLTYYVSAGGHSDTPSDTNSCATARTLSTPKASITSALQCLAAGDTLSIRGGTYLERIDSAASTIPGGTSFTNATLITNYNGETVNLTPSGSTAVVRFSATGNQYIIVSGLVLDGGTTVMNVINVMSPAHHIRFQNITSKRGVNRLVQFDGCAGCELLNSSIESNQSVNGAVVVRTASTDTLIQGNDIFNYLGPGISDRSQSGGTNLRTIIRANTIRAPQATIADPAIWAGEGNDALIVNNIVNTGFGGIRLTAPASGERVYNNTIYGTSSYGILVDTSVSGSLIRNNIAYQAGGITNNGSGGTISNNQITDPLFTNAAIGNFHLQAGSTARDAGVTLADVPTDFVGTPRPLGPAYDLGVWEEAPVVAPGATAPPKPFVLRIVR